MLRRIAIALVILVSILATLPLATSLAHNLRFQTASVSHHRARHSRAWWRRHRAKVRRRLAMIARRRALLAAQNGNALAAAQNANTLVAPGNANALAAAQNANTLVAPQNANALVAQNAKTWIAAQNVNALVTAQNANALVTPQKANALVAAQNANALVAAQNANALVAPQNGNAFTPAAEKKVSTNHVVLPTALSFPENFYRDGSLALPLPTGWTSAANSKGSSVFRIAAPNGMPGGKATLSVVAITPANLTQPIGREQRRMLGGVSFTDLRRTVIDRMISAGGWVVNDRERQIGGQRVFQVIAQTPATTAGGAEQIWNFYFTEMNGRVYSLTTHTGGDMSDKLTADAENFLSAFNPVTTPSPVKKKD